MASAPEFEITELTAADFDGWSAAFKKFLDFYETSLDEEQYHKTFERLVQKREGLEGLVVRQNAGGGSTIVGFAHFFLTQTTWSEKKILFLDDLFVDSSVRGGGLGRKLIESVRDIARSRDCLRVAWITGNDNVAAQGLYDKLGTSLFREYRMALE